jgi:hypothetical protein
MRRGQSLALVAALLLATGGALVLDAVASNAATKPAAAATSKSKNDTRQFTGYVTASDPSTLTVEKRGKKPRTVVFARHAEMKTTGEVGKNAHVTVYYRDEGGKPVAHKVVAKKDK